jgi:hypothetical protein
LSGLELFSNLPVMRRSVYSVDAIRLSVEILKMRPMPPPIGTVKPVALTWSP